MSRQLPSVTSPPWSSGTKQIVALTLLAALILFARSVNRHAWGALIVALVLAYLLSPLVTFFERRLKIIRMTELRRTLSVWLAWMAVLGMVSLIIGLIVPATFNQMRAFANELPAMIKDTEKDLKEVLSKPIRIGDFTLVPWDELQKAFATEEGETAGTALADTLQNAVLSMADPALTVLGGAVAFLIATVFTLVMLFFLMRDGPQFVAYLVHAVPESYRGDMLRLLHELGLIWNAYLRGQIWLGVAVGVATYLAALILGLPQPLVLGLLAGFLEFVPNMGPILASIPALLFALATPSSTIPALEAGLMYALVVAVVYTAIQQLEAIFLVPRILGHSLDLHPFVVLVAIVIGAGVAGALGVILAAPSVATLRLLMRYLRGKLLDEELFPTGPSTAAPPRGFIFRLIEFFLNQRFPVSPLPEVDERAIQPYDRSDTGYWE